MINNTLFRVRVVRKILCKKIHYKKTIYVKLSKNYSFLIKNLSIPYSLRFRRIDYRKRVITFFFLTN